MVLRASGVAATPSRWRSRVQIPSAPRPYSSAAERSPDAREVPLVGSGCGYFMPRWRNGIARLATNQEGAGSIPARGTQGWLAQWESTRSTPAGRRFDSFAGYGGCGVAEASEAVNLRGRGQHPAITPRVGGAAATALGCKPSIPRAGSSPARPT